jgi:hypothetical protein
MKAVLVSVAPEIMSTLAASSRFRRSCRVGNLRS